MWGAAAVEQAGSKRKLYLGCRGVARREVGRRRQPIPRGPSIGMHRQWVFSLADVDRVYAENHSPSPSGGITTDLLPVVWPPSFYACEESNPSKQACSLGSCKCIYSGFLFLSISTILYCVRVTEEWNDGCFFRLNYCVIWLLLSGPYMYSPYMYATVTRTHGRKNARDAIMHACLSTRRNTHDHAQVLNLHVHAHTYSVRVS